MDTQALATEPEVRVQAIKVARTVMRPTLIYAAEEDQTINEDNLKNIWKSTTGQGKKRGSQTW